MRQTLVVTGSSRGLGRFVAEQAMAAGYRVVGLARSPASGAAFDSRACDVSDPQQVESTLHDLRRDESVVALVNTAGIASMNLVLTTPVETMAKIISTNLLGTIYCCQTIGRILARNKFGRIVNFSTIAVPLALEGEAVYSASKAGVEAFSRVFAREMAGHGVTVNTIAPGPIDTRLIANLDERKIRALVERQIVRRQGTPEDVWNIVKLLLSKEAGMVTGEVVHVGGI